MIDFKGFAWRSVILIEIVIVGGVLYHFAAPFSFC
jgi:hypothetical protein